MIPERNMNVQVGANIFVTKVGRYVNRDKSSKLLAVLGRGNLMMWIILYDVADACCKSRVIIQTIGLNYREELLECKNDHNNLNLAASYIYNVIIMLY